MKRIADTVSVVQMCKVCHVFHHFCNFASVASAFLRAEKIQTILEIDLARYDKKQIEKKNWRKSKNQKFTVAWGFYTLNHFYCFTTFFNAFHHQAHRFLTQRGHLLSYRTILYDIAFPLYERSEYAEPQNCSYSI